VEEPIETEKINSNLIGKIPVRNLWFLMFYAHKLFEHQSYGKFSTDEAPDDIPDLLAEILIYLVEKRLMRNLTYGYQHQERTLSRMRGRIDHLKTARDSLLSKGKIACRFDELSVNTPRNQYVRAALDAVAKRVQDQDLSHRCRKLSHSLLRMGVVGERPPNNQVVSERFGHHDIEDKEMVMASRLVFNLALPTEREGDQFHQQADRSEKWVRKLFEKGIAGFYAATLSRDWTVKAGSRIQWPVDQKTELIDKILPSMQTDIILESKKLNQKIVIDTKFAAITAKGHYRDRGLKSGYLYQIYAYLRTQEEDENPRSRYATGVLLHPSIGEMMDESVDIQGHKICFSTVDLSASEQVIRDQLLELVSNIEMEKIFNARL
jgi:5-methylcytosine-specific restriction enzyme subunit McrC